MAFIVQIDEVVHPSGIALVIYHDQCAFSLRFVSFNGIAAFSDALLEVLKYYRLTHQPKDKTDDKE